VICPSPPQAVDISALCADIVSTAASFARQRGVEVKFDGCGDALSSADGELMELMMLNLLTNSLMHTDKGGFVRLGVSSYDGGIMLSVDDSGCGIAPEVLRDIFSRYRRTLSLSDMSEGAGLGLAIARGIAEKHGGALIIESRPGYGASVRVPPCPGPSPVPGV
jgi:signal transduction histidine kinase